MKRVLVTGATGFIGRQALLPLLARGYEVHALYSKAPIQDNLGIVWHQADLLQQSVAETICAEIKPTHLLHLAWYVKPADYKDSPENERWVPATLALLEGFQKNGGTRAVLAGTCMEYDWTTGQDFLKEHAPTASLVRYSRTKNETRFAAEKFARETGLSFAWGRIFNLYGPFEGEIRLVPKVINALLNNEKPRIGHGVTLDYSYVLDTADAFAALVESDVQGAINIASGKAVTPVQIGKIIAEIIGGQDLIEDELPVPKDKQQRVVADVTRLTKEVGWQPKYDLHTGLAETIQWWRQDRRV